MTLVSLFNSNITLIGFTSSSWTSDQNGSYQSDSKAALYQYDPNGKKTSFGVISPAQAIYNEQTFGPIFGRNDLGIYFLENNKAIVSRNHNGTYGFNNGNEKFNEKVKEIEVSKVNF